MDLPSIDKVIVKLVKSFQTRNPYRIARELGMLVVEEDLEELFGYYSNFNRIKIIHVNSRLNSQAKNSTCAHELGHAILHPNENTPMLSKHTMVSELKIEMEANYFATKLIMNPDEDGFQYLTSYKKLEYFGLPLEFERFI